MNMTYVRVALYFLAPILGALPGVTIDTEAMKIILDIPALAAGITVAGGVSAAIFAKFGKK